MSWIFERACAYHDAACDCDDVSKHDRWRLYDDRQRPIGAVQRFSDEGPYYGTWEVDAAALTCGGRTGAMATLEDCQKSVFAALCCDHRHWSFKAHGRWCTCGTLMTDPGD